MTVAATSDVRPAKGSRNMKASLAFSFAAGVPPLATFKEQHPKKRMALIVYS
jgi:hypothetical protein